MEETSVIDEAEKKDTKHTTSHETGPSTLKSKKRKYGHTLLFLRMVRRCTPSQNGFAPSAICSNLKCYEVQGKLQINAKKTAKKQGTHATTAAQ